MTGTIRSALIGECIKGDFGSYWDDLVRDGFGAIRHSTFDLRKPTNQAVEGRVSNHAEAASQHAREDRDEVILAPSVLPDRFDGTVIEGILAERLFLRSFGLLEDVGKSRFIRSEERRVGKECRSR